MTSFTPLTRRTFVAGVAAQAALATGAAEPDVWGAQEGYPTGWGNPRGLSRHKNTRVGNFSGGFETMLPGRTIQAGAEMPLVDRPRMDIQFSAGIFRRDTDDYLNKWPITSLLIARGGEVWVEKYRFDRTAEMRMTGYSMSKSVTSLLFGIAMDRGLISSLEDHPSKYVPALEGKLHGEVTLRNLLNMSSGAAVLHEEAGRTIYPMAFTEPNSSIVRTVAGWNSRREPEGTRFNYNELCPLTIGMVIRAVAGKSLSEFAQEALWKPIGAEGNATWSTDPMGTEFNCIGFAARVRDWARLGQLVAQQGHINGQQVISRAWMDSYSRWELSESQVRYGAMPNRNGYSLAVTKRSCGTPNPTAHNLSLTERWAKESLSTFRRKRCWCKRRWTKPVTGRRNSMPYFSQR